MEKQSRTRKSGSVHRRIFPGVRLDAALELELRRAEALSYPMEWRDDAAGLAVSRSWIEGTDYRQIFGECTPQDRILYSQDLFTSALERLEDLRHGAVHPGNVLHVGSSPVFLDPVVNAARLGPTQETTSEEHTQTYTVWLWAPRIPAGWKVVDWDRVNLLRMMALLARGPTAWEKAPARAEAVALCRRWAEEFHREKLSAGDDRVASLAHILELLERLEREPESDGFATVAQLLSDSLKRRGEDRMLRPADEDEIRSRAQEKAADPNGELLAVELLRQGVRRQSELKSQAEAFLQAGVHPGTRYVKRSACRNAVRLYLAYGVAKEEAQEEVRSLLGALDLRDEVAAQVDWSERVDEYVGKHCRHGYSSRHLRQMTEMVVGLSKLPGQVAETQLRRYLDQKKLSERRGFLGIG